MYQNPSAAFYRPLLRHAWRTTWQRKTLWIFGMFAAIMSTGGVMEIALRSFRHMESGGAFMNDLMNNSFALYQLIGQYMHGWVLLDQSRATYSIVLFMAVAVILVLAAMVSQIGLIRGISSRKPLAMREALKNFEHPLWQVIVLDLLTKITTGLLVILMTLPLVLLWTQTTLLNALLYLILFLVFFPLVIVVNIVATLALIEIVNKNHHALDAIELGFRTFRDHALAAIELGLLLFLLGFFAGVAGVIAIFLLSIPYAILIALSLLTAIPFFFILINALGVIALMAIILVCTGIITTFQHAAWVFYWEQTKSVGLKKPILSIIHRILRA